MIAYAIQDTIAPCSSHKTNAKYLAKLSFLSTSSPLVFFLTFFLLFKYSCLHFPRPPQPSLPPTLDTTPLLFCPCVLYSCFWKPFPLSPPLSPPTSPLVTVSLFLISLVFWVFVFVVVNLKISYRKVSYVFFPWELLNK